MGLGDPAGAASDLASAIWRLRDLAREEKRSPAVWQAGPALLDLYADLGLTGLPLDADGVPMADAEDAPSPHATSFLVCQAERDLPELLKLLPAWSKKAPAYEGQMYPTPEGALKQPTDSGKSSFGK